MSLKTFKTYNLAVEYHKECNQLRLPHYLKEQLLRASSSIALNLAEGSAKPTKKDQIKFYAIAFGSLRETQAVMDVANVKNEKVLSLSHQIGGCLYRLVNGKGGGG